MKRREIQKLHQLSLKELKEMLFQVEKELVDLKMTSGREKAKDIRAMAKKRDDLARIKTILREKQFLAEVEEPSFAKATEGKEKNEKV
jgi:ribosomal protein L29